MKRVHEMPLGASVLSDGKVRFRLWASAARTVEICLEIDKSGLTVLWHLSDDGGRLMLLANLGDNQVEGDLHFADTAFYLSQSDLPKFSAPAVCRPSAGEFSGEADCRRGRAILSLRNNNDERTDNYRISQ